MNSPDRPSGAGRLLRLVFIIGAAGVFTITFRNVYGGGASAASAALYGAVYGGLTLAVGFALSYLEGGG